MGRKKSAPKYTDVASKVEACLKFFINEIDKESKLRDVFSVRLYDSVSNICQRLSIKVKSVIYDLINYLKGVDNFSLVGDSYDERLIVRNSSSKLIGRVECKGTPFGFITDINSGERFHFNFDGEYFFVSDDIVEYVPEVTFLDYVEKDTPECYILGLVERVRHEVTGLVVKDRYNGFFFDMGSHGMGMSYWILPELLDGIKAGTKVVATLSNSLEYYKSPIEEIRKIGPAKNLSVNRKAVIIDYGLSDSFDDEAKKEIKQIEHEVKEEEISGRTDLRNELIFTIDGDDSKDFDDAISVKKERNKYVLGVHIADVSHYVKKDSAIDKEAIKRGFSTYFPDYVIPMLPEQLSNCICSLNENVDRLTITCEMIFDDSGEKVSSKIYKSVINSKHRMTYKKVQKIIDGDEELIDEYRDIYESLKNAQELAKLIHEVRLRKGCIDLQSNESGFDISNGKIENVFIKEKGESENIIEEFMVSANETVARFLEEKELPCIYRVHEEIASDKAVALEKFLENNGINVSLKEDKSSEKIQKILESVRGSKNEYVINRFVLRTMQKAKYLSRNIGHYGLGSECYCHFTSPIRRYPDLFVHRILSAVLLGEEVNKEKIEDNAQKLGNDLSVKERNIIDAERKLENIYKVIYMINNSYRSAGIVTSIIKSGFFVELENGIEGFVALRDLNNYYYYNEVKQEFSDGRIRIYVGKKIDSLRAFDFDIEEGKIGFYCNL